jgi:hypothetical protein
MKGKVWLIPWVWQNTGGEVCFTLYLCERKVEHRRLVLIFTAYGRFAAMA